MISIIIKRKNALGFTIVREEFWVNPWLVSHAKNVIRGAYDDCGHFNCSVVGARLFNG